MRSVLDDIAEFRRNPANDRLFAQERMIVELTSLVCREMQRQAVSEAELAARMGRKTWEVRQMLGGGRLFTLRALSDMLYALGRSLEPATRPADSPAAAVDRSHGQDER